MSGNGEGGKLRHLTLVDRVGAFGGAERVAIELSKRLPSHRFERLLCATRWTPEVGARPQRAATIEDLSRHGVRFVGLERTSSFDLRSWRRLVRFMRQERIDILHAHMFGSNLWAALLGPFAGVPVVVAHEHTWSFDGGVARRLLDRGVIARRCSIVVAVSREDRRRMISMERMKPEQVI
jgi:hypothetical protein